MKHMARSCLKISISSNKVCELCPLTKHTRITFTSSCISTTLRFELIYCDIWDAVQSYLGPQYFLTRSTHGLPHMF